MTATPAFLDINDLEVSFPTDQGLVHAVQKVSFSLTKGRTLGIVGESGSGKSVLCRTIMGLIPRSAHVPDRAKILFDGIDLRALSTSRWQKLRGRRIAMIFQNPMTSLNPTMTVGAQIIEVVRLHQGLNKKDARACTVSLLSDVDIPSPKTTIDVYPHQLSGGLRQRVAIAIALAGEPDLLIADEPTTALDVTVQAGLLDLLQNLQRKRQMAMILITHDLGVVAGRCDNVLVMYAGRVVERASTEALFANPRMPYTSALLASMPRLDDPVGTLRPAIPGSPPDLRQVVDGCAFAPRCTHTSDKCRQQQPPLQTDAQAEQRYACWHPTGKAS
jgi:peptide/nickel transport system ATP-binding protein